MVNNLTLAELLQHMEETAGNPETSTAFHQAHDLYVSRMMLIRSSQGVGAFFKEIMEAKKFLETNEILGLNHENMIDQIEDLELVSAVAVHLSDSDL